MNPLFDFSAKEINMIQLALFAVARSTEATIEEGVEAPDGFLETLESVINKLNLVIESRIENDKQFELLVEANLKDVESASIAIEKDPEVSIEYN